MLRTWFLGSRLSSSGVDPNKFSNISLDLELLELWEAQWCLKFNVEKCMFMQIGLSNPKNQYYFGGESLRCVDNEKDLGVVFNSSFSFEDHVRNSITKANRTIAWVTRNVISRPGNQALCWALFAMALICLVVWVGLLLLGQRLIGLPQGRLTFLPRGSSATGIGCLLKLNVVSR